MEEPAPATQDVVQETVNSSGVQPTPTLGVEAPTPIEPSPTDPALESYPENEAGADIARSLRNGGPPNGCLPNGEGDRYPDDRYPGDRYPDDRYPGDRYPGYRSPSPGQRRRVRTMSADTYSDSSSDEEIPLAPKPTTRGTWVTLEEAWPEIKDALDLPANLSEVFKKLEKNAREKDTKEPPPPLPELKHMTLAEWGILPTDPKVSEHGTEEERQEYVFEVLTEEPIKIRRGPSSWKESDTESRDTDDAKRASIAARSVTGSVPKSWSKSPSQLRIASKPLIYNFKDIVPKFNWDGPLKAGRLMIIRPFKMLFLYEKEIRDRYQVLEKKWASVPDESTQTADPSESTTSLPDESTTSLAESSELKPDTKDEVQQLPTPEHTPEPAPDAKDEVQPLPTPDHIPEPTPDTKDEVQPLPTPDHTPEPTPEPALEEISERPTIERLDTRETEEPGARTPDPTLGRATPGRATPRRKKKARILSPPSEKKPSKEDEEKNSRTALEHFRLLIQFMDEDLKHLSELRRAIRDGTLEKICFDDLWHLFDYGQEVLIRDKEQPDKTTAHKVLKFTGGRNIRVNTQLDPPLIRPISDALGPGMWDGAFAVQCWSLHFDSDLYWPHEEVRGIRRYDGEKEIVSLPVYPMKFDPRPGLKDELFQQGRIFKHFASTKSSHRRYYGKNYDKDARGEHIDSEVIIDFKEATNQNRNWLPDNLLADNDQIDHDTRELWEEFPDHAHCKAKGWCIRDCIGPDFALDQDIFEAFVKDNKLMLEPKENVDDSELILMPHEVFGYVLNQKTWAKLSTSRDCLQEIQATSDPWNDLVLDQPTKDIVEALVTQHLQRPINSNNEIDAPFQLGDFLVGKGRGLVFLLHGPPGVGKTSTAETIAAHCSKPLYNLTSGNLGVRPDDVEDNLQSHFTLAERWGCILLLDEADVFLQRRRLNALDINAIVSVFLRQLEYYKGILFLTTNRVGDMDPAFKSRIHVTLEYSPLDRKRTKKIYKLHLKRIKEALEDRKKRFGRGFSIQEDEILTWADKHFKESKKKNRQWNGRQIHNAFQTAVALAEWESRSGDKEKPVDAKPRELVLSKRQFKQVASVSEGFDQYITDLFGGKDESAIAASSGQRLDFRPKSGKDSKKKADSSSESGSDSDSDTEPKKKSKKKEADSDENDSSDEEPVKKKTKDKKDDEKKKGKSKSKKDESDSD